MILSVLSSPALVSGLMVVRAKNPVHSVLFPIPVFRDTSGLLLLLGLDFSAMIFPVVHIGAIAVSFLFVVMIPRVWKGAKVVLRRMMVSFFFILICPALWDWGFTWVAPFFVFFGDWVDFLLSPMDNLPLSVGGGGSDAGPSRRPVLDLNSTPEPELDLNQPPAQEPEHRPNPSSGFSIKALREELRKTVKRLRVAQGLLHYWENLTEIELRKERESREKARLFEEFMSSWRRGP